MVLFSLIRIFAANFNSTQDYGTRRQKRIWIHGGTHHGVRPPLRRAATAGLRLPEALQGHGPPERTLRSVAHPIVPRCRRGTRARLPKQWRAVAMIRLYHGSNQKIEVPDLQHSKPFKDFGSGFYLSPDKQQA